VADFNSKKPSATYQSILNLGDSDNQTMDGTLRPVEDARGNESALKLSTAAAQVDNIKIDGNTISTETSDLAIALTPDGTGDVQLNADTVRVGDNNADATITTQGTGDLTLNTNAGSSSGTIKIYDASNGNIDITPNGTGEVNISKVDIDAGAIDGTPIGATSHSTGKFTTLETTGDITASAGFNLSGGIFRGSVATLTSGTHNSYSAVGKFIIKLDSASGNVILTGFTGGVIGQIIYIIKSSSSNTSSIHNDVTSTQRIFTRSGANETVGQSGVKASNPRGGWILVCDGTHWYSIGR